MKKGKFINSIPFVLKLSVLLDFTNFVYPLKDTFSQALQDKEMPVSVY